MDTPDTLTPFTVDTTVTPPVVTVDGIDVTRAITGASVHVGYAQPTRLILHEVRPGTVAATGLVDVAGSSPVDRVRALDAQQVEELAMSLDVDGCMAEAYIAAIVDLLDRP